MVAFFCSGFGTCGDDNRLNQFEKEKRPLRHADVYRQLLLKPISFFRKTIRLRKMLKLSRATSGQHDSTAAERC